MTCKSFHLVSCGESEPKELIQIQGEKKETLRRYYCSNCSNLFSTLSVTPTRTQYTACFFFFFFFFDSAISLEVYRSGVKPQPNYRAARWPSRSPTTVVMLAHCSLLSPLSLSFANWVSSLAPQLPLSALRASSSCFHVLLPLLKPVLMDSCLLKMDYNKHLT